MRYLVPVAACQYQAFRPSSVSVSFRCVSVSFRCVSVSWLDVRSQQDGSGWPGADQLGSSHLN